MKLFDSIVNSVKPTAKRFPAFFIYSILSFACFCVTLINDELSENEFVSKLFTSFGLTFAWGIFFILFLQLIYEIKLNTHEVEKTKRMPFVLGQSLSIIIVAPLCFFIYKYIFINQNMHMILFIAGTLIVFIFLSVFLLSFFQDKNIIIPRIICSSFFSFCIAISVAIGFSIIWFAINSLLHEFLDGETVYSIIWTLFVYIYVDCYVSFATVDKPEYTVPKFFKTLMYYVLLPLYTALLAVLYVYLFKCIIFTELPKGLINWFVSFATVIYIIFYFSFLSYKTKVLDFFYKFGALFLIPLVCIQIVAFVIRINAYGFTALRVASLFYILFSIWFIAFTFVKKGKFINLAYVVFAILVLFATVTPFNVRDFSNRNQEKRMISVLNKHNMFDGEKIINQKNSEQMSDEEKRIVMSAYDELREKGRTPEWLKESNNNAEKISIDNFEKIFGFEYKTNYTEKIKEILYCNVELDKDLQYIDVSEYNTLYKFDEYNKDLIDDSKIKVYLKIDNVKYDITDTVNSYMVKIDKSTRIYQNAGNKILSKPIEVNLGNGLVIFITELYAICNIENQEFSQMHIAGYALK
ncbi:MAG: DUF4153 domain-containing protein [Treponema sp.]